MHFQESYESEIDLQKKEMTAALFGGLAYKVTCFRYYMHIEWERSGSVVECLTRDRGVAGSSLTSVTVVVVLEQDTFILA